MIRSLFSSTTSASVSALHRMLDVSVQLAPTHRNQFVNHLPMALHALSDLGATPERMQAFSTQYLLDHEVADAPAPATAPADWLALQGQMNAFAPLRAYFEQAQSSEGADVLLHRVLPDLLAGLASGAFHGVIRVAHAVQGGHPGELACALAYWAGCWEMLAPPRTLGAIPAATATTTAAPGLLRFDEWTSRLMVVARNWHSDGRSITAQMEDASHTPMYQEMAGALAPLATTHDRVEELARLALAIYIGSGDFTAIHMITGLRALRVLLPWIENPEPLQSVLVHAVTAACLVSQAPYASRQVTYRRADWSSVMLAAIASNDAHVIKLVHACREEAAAYGEPSYLDAAALALGWAVGPSHLRTPEPRQGVAVRNGLSER